MIVDPGPLVYRGSLTATHTARAVAGSNGFTRVISIDIQGLAVHRGGVTRTLAKARRPSLLVASRRRR